MANKKIWLGMLVIILAFGMTVMGCDGSGGESDHGTLVVKNTSSVEYQASTTVNSSVNAVQAWTRIKGGQTSTMHPLLTDWEGDYITVYYQPSSSFVSNPSPDSISRKSTYVPKGEKVTVNIP